MCHHARAGRDLYFRSDHQRLSVIMRHHYNLGMLFLEQAQTHAARPALRFAESDVRYEELLDLVAALANFLIECELKRGDVIAIAHTKDRMSYALMLAAIRLGVPYFNIDVASPQSRNDSILATCAARLLFVDNFNDLVAMQELCHDRDCAVIALADAALTPTTDDQWREQEARMRDVDSASIAYIMFTSGSTGTPKGVAVTHQNVLHFIQWGRDRFGITPDDNFANLSPMYFDNSVFDFYIALFSGASLTPVHRRLLNAPGELVAFVATMECTIWFSVPSLLIYLVTMKAMTPTALLRCRYFVFGGEGYPKVELVKLHRMYGSQATLVNVYGPTECTCICSAYDLSDADFQELDGLPPLGRLNPNFDHQILDNDGREAELGELCLIGPNVAAGYFNDLQRTALVFVTLTEPGRFMKRSYRTGDLVRRDRGQLFFIGRKDNQIKHMGYRIELEEIEHGLMKLPGVNQAAAVYLRSGAAFGKIHGFVASTEALDERQLLNQLPVYLPDYMIPSRIVVIDKMPKTPNGKIDRQRLASLLAEPRT
ncbi:AMP-binding protein [Tardiphaga sp. vice352]|uniref:AMP-binding protein n=1 Tax=Tardiphaga sp. vice352 TaxID=2592816 RepID=UPI00143D3871|nr:AMP-binding protein [Tardiphaga sp. vice352]